MVSQTMPSLNCWMLNKIGINAKGKVFLLICIALMSVNTPMENSAALVVKLALAEKHMRSLNGHAVL
jgi:hypothetical protein